MEKEDISIKYFETFYNSKDKLLKITLKDNSIIEGIFVGVYHGDKQLGEPFVIKWHFVQKEDIQKYGNAISVDGAFEIGKIIKQEDIKNVEFR